jgi:hypothetical protein
MYLRTSYIGTLPYFNFSIDYSECSRLAVPADTLLLAAAPPVQYYFASAIRG